MRAEAILFLGVAAFFTVTGGVYAATSDEPAGIAALIVSVLMAALIAFYLLAHYLRHGERIQDRAGVHVRKGFGPLGFFPPRSYYPVLTAAGTALVGLGVVFGPWLLLIGFGLTVPAAVGFVLQYGDRGAGE